MMGESIDRAPTKDLGRENQGRWNKWTPADVLSYQQAPRNGSGEYRFARRFVLQGPGVTEIVALPKQLVAQTTLRVIPGESSA